MCLGKPGGGEGAENTRGEAVRFSSVCRDSRKGRAGGKQYRFGNSHLFLVVDKFLVAPRMKIYVLMDIDNFFAWLRSRRSGLKGCRADRSSERP